MAGIVERISIIIDSKVDGATQGFKKLKQDITEADGAAGKFKAGFAGVASGVKANAGMLAATAGAALVAFGVKAVGAFTDTAKAAIDMSKATGLSVEQASRWIAVGDDFEVTASELAGAIGRIGKDLDSSKWEQYGIATRDAAGNARAANDVLLDVFEVLNNTAPAERAKVGAELLGRGWQSIAPLLGQTRDAYKDMLATVEGGQVITDGEAKKAEKMRLAQDALSDALGELGLAFGEMLSAGSPVITLLADLTTTAADLIGVVTGGDAKDMSEPVQAFLDTLNSGDSGAVVDITGEFSKLIEQQKGSASTLSRGAQGWKMFVGELADNGSAAAANLKAYRAAFDQVLAVDPGAAQKIVNSLLIDEQLITLGDQSVRDYWQSIGMTKDVMSELQSQVNTGTAPAIEDLSGATDDAATAEERFEAATRATNEVLKEQFDRLDDVLGSMYDLEEAILNNEDAYAKYKEALEAAHLAAGDANLTDADRDQIMRDLRDSQIDVAEGALDIAEEFARSKGAADGSKESFDLMRESLIKQQEQYPLLADEIQRYIDKLGQIPGTVNTNVQINNGNAGPSGVSGGGPSGAPGQSGGGNGNYTAPPGGRGVEALSTGRGGVSPSAGVSFGDINVTVNGAVDAAQIGEQTALAIKAAIERVERGTR